MDKGNMMHTPHEILFALKKGDSGVCDDDMNDLEDLPLDGAG